MLKKAGIIAIIILMMLGTIEVYATTSQGETILNSEQTG